MCDHDLGQHRSKTKNVSGWIMQRQLDVVTCDSYDGGCVVELVEHLQKAGPNVFRHPGMPTTSRSFGTASEVANALSTATAACLARKSR
jgi:hypothetical protein